MNTKVLEYIIAIAEEQSVSRAAERFYLSHPALSAHLKKLEQELGTPLFRRSSKGVRPTPAGLIFLADARAILHEEQKLQKALTVMRHQQQHVIRVTMDTPFYNAIVRRILPDFYELYPDYTVDIIRCNAVQGRRELLDGGATMGALISATPRSADLVYLPFYSGSLKLVFPAGYPGKKDIQCLREALDSGMFLSMYPRDYTVNMIIRQRLEAERIDLKNSMEGDGRSIIAHVKSGNTCGVLPDFFCPLAEQEGLAVGEVFAPLYHVIAYSPGAALSPAVQDLMRLMIEELVF